MKNHEGTMMIRFHTCLILIKDIENVIRDATNMWKNIYHLHKPSEDPIEIKDNDNSESDDFESTPSIIVTPGELHTLMEDVEEEDKEGETLEEDEDEEDPVRIATEVIATFLTLHQRQLHQLWR